MSQMTAAWRGQAHGLLEGQKGVRECSVLVRNVIICLIVLNGIAVVAESNRGLYANYQEWFNAFELFSVVVFTIEYLARIWVST